MSPGHAASRLAQSASSCAHHPAQEASAKCQDDQLGPGHAASHLAQSSSSCAHHPAKETPAECQGDQ